MASLRKTSWVFAGLVLLGAGVAGGLMLLGPSPWFSDPTAVRAWSDRGEVLNPAQPAAFDPDTNLLAGLTVTTNERELVIESQQTARSPREWIAWQRVDADASLRADVGAGTVALEYIGTGYGSPSEGADAEYAVRVPGRFFTPGLRPIEEADLEAFGVQRWDRELDYQDGMPAVKLGLKLEGIDGFKLLGLKAFDGRTQAPVSGSGYSHGASEGRYSVETSLAIWHATPIEFVLDLAVGPPEVFEFPARTGTIQRFPGGAAGLVALVNGPRRSWSSISDGTVKRTMLRFAPDDGEDGCSAVLLLEPDAHPMPVDFELLDARGEALPGAGGGSSGRMVIKSVRAALGEVSTVRLLYYPHHRRVRFRLPEIPGLPKTDAPVGNLFDIRVPYARFRYESSLRQWVEKVLQFKIRSRVSPTLPPGTLPLTFTNATAGEILQAYLEFHPPNIGAWVNEDTHELVISRSKLAELGDQVLKWLSGRFN